MTERFSLRRIGMAHYDGDSTIAAFAHFDPQRHSAQERHVVGVGESFSAAFAKYVVPSAGVGREEVAHVFNNSQHRYRDGFKHPRSEERRVGKECRSRWSPYD